MPGELIAFGNNGLVAFGTKENELLTHSRTIEEMLHANAHDGTVWTMPFDAIDPDATDKKFGYIKNESKELNLHCRHFSFLSTVSGILEVIRVTGTAAGGTSVELTNDNHSHALETPEGIFESGVDITGLADGGKHRFIKLVQDVQREITIPHDIILGNNGAIALNWPESTGIITGTIGFYTHVKGDDE